MDKLNSSLYLLDSRLLPRVDMAYIRAITPITFRGYFLLRSPNAGETSPSMAGLLQTLGQSGSEPRPGLQVPAQLWPVCGVLAKSPLSVARSVAHVVSDWRLTGNTKAKDIMLLAAESLVPRYSAKVSTPSSAPSMVTRADPLRSAA